MSQLIAIYARVSTEEQAKHGFSIPAQIRDCQERIGNRQALVFADEGVSGETLQRPALEELRRKIQRGEIDTVYCLDRIGCPENSCISSLLTEEWESRESD